MRELNKYVFYNYSENDQQIVLYNSYTHEMCAIKSSDGDIDTALRCLSSTQEDYLSNHYFFEEKDGVRVSTFVESTRNRIKYSRRSASFTIHLSYGCNMKCSYCYQNDIKANISIDDKTERDLYSFFEKVKKQNELEVIDIVFIGGEPLLFASLMFRMIEKIQTIFSEQEIRYGIVTNGTLFNASIINKLKETTWSYIQVTLDGPKDVHNEQRMFKNGRGSFSTIVEGIQKCNEANLPVVININVGKNNYNLVSDLLSYLQSHNIRNQVQFSYIFECAGDLRSKNSIADFSEDYWYEAHTIAKQYGYHFSPFYRLSYMVCGSCRVNDFIISPDGKLYKCISGIGTDEYFLSDINDYATETYWKRLSQFVEYDNLKEKCYQCKFEIVCGGWCRYKKNVYGEYCPYVELEKNDLKMAFECI